jgi:hypothetical protein
MSPDEIRGDNGFDRALAEIQADGVPADVLEAARARVWRNLTAEPAEHISGCAEFQELFADYRRGSLPEARALLVQDHLHECVACRRVFEGRVVPLPVAPAPRPRASYAPRWAIAAGVVAAGGLVIWFSVVRYGAPSTGRAMVQSINGTLYEISPAGLRVMSAGEPLPDGVRIRTARDSGAVVVLSDGSRVEVRERSELSCARDSSDTSLRLDRGSLIVQAAKRRSGHMFVATADCRVAVTGTLFSVSAGVKGSRISVAEGEVHVSRDNRETILHPGGQLSTSDSLEAVPVPDDFAWTHNARLQRELSALRESLGQAHMPQVRYSSRLLGLLPASTMFYAAIPNLSGYFDEARGIFHHKAAENAELRAWLTGPGAAIEPVLAKLEAANEYLGDEIVVFATASSPAPVFLAEVKRPGLPEFLRKAGLPLAVETRPGLVLLSPNPKAVAVPLDSTFSKTAFYARIAEAYRQGAGLLVSADLKSPMAPPSPPALLASARYMVAEQKQIAGRLETRAVIDLEGPRAGIAAWLAPPSPMGALEYITSEATLVTAFAVTSPASVLDQLPRLSPQGPDSRPELAASLGGEFALALDGPALPVPSWKLVAEVYDPARFEAAVEKAAAEFNRQAAATGGKKLRAAREESAGRAYYTIAWGDPNPLSEAHYTFDSGYLIAAPTRTLLGRALEAHANGTGIVRSPTFAALLPHDPYANFSGVLYQNLGTTLAPIAGLLNPKGAAEFADLKPFLLAAYGEGEHVTLASSGDLLGMSFGNFLSGGILGMARNMIPMAQILGTTREQVPSR